jgi:hypothetical protein
MNQDQNTGAKIARIWRGTVATARADDYQRYLLETGIPPLEKSALRVEVFREDRADESEFMAVSYWPSVEAMSAFAGANPRQIHHLDRDKEFLAALPSAVQILKIIG